MTLAELIAYCEETRPSQYDKDIMTRWVNEIEHKVHDEVINKAEHHHKRFDPYVYDEDADRILAVPEPYTDVYLSYLYAKIDFTNAEYDRYNNDLMMHNNVFTEYASWFRRNNLPKATHFGHKEHHHRPTPLD